MKVLKVPTIVMNLMLSLSRTIIDRNEICTVTFK